MSDLPKRNPFFTGREHFLIAIAAFFAGHPTQPLALCGIGGIGKTQIAIEYVSRHQQEYQTVIWFDASSLAVLGVEIGVFADQYLQVTDAERTNEPQLFAAVKSWLWSQDRWLLVLDHIEDLTLVQRIVPDQREDRTHILLTTRQQVPESLAHGLTIPKMNTVEGALLVLRRSGHIPLDASPETITWWITLIQHDLSPAESETVVTQYLSSDLLSDQTTSFEIMPLSEEIKQTLQHLSSKSLALLRLLSFLPPDVPEHLLLDDSSLLSNPLRSFTPLDLDQLLTELLGVSLMDRSEGMLHVPPIVQESVLESLTSKQHRSYARQVVRLVNRSFPVVRFDTRAEWERLLPLAKHGATLIAQYGLTVKAGGLLLERLGNACFRRASYAEAETYLTQARDLYEHALNEKVLDRAQTLNTLGLLYSEIARYHDAEVCHRQALELRERVLGPEHSTTAESLHNLATLAGQRGNDREAERLYLQVLQIAATHDDPDIATTLNNLGTTYFEMGRYTEAEEFYQRALTAYEQEQGSDHPNLAAPLNGLGRLAEEQEDYPRAEEFYQRTLAIREQALGPAHPDIAYCLNDLADVYTSQGTYQRAEAFYQRALTMLEQALGETHPDVALLLNNLAYLADKQDHAQEAETLYQRALHIYEQVLGPEHRYVASVLYNLGRLYHHVGDRDRAESFLRQALALREQIQPEHADVAQSLSALADLLMDQHRDQETEPLLQRAFALYLLAYGPEHPDVGRVQEKIQKLQERANKGE